VCVCVRVCAVRVCVVCVVVSGFVCACARACASSSVECTCWASCKRKVRRRPANTTILVNIKQ
jgi:hypothetical protein